MLRVEMLPARQGDSLWIEYGEPAHPHRVLVDAGTPGTWAHIRERLRALPADQRHLELLIVSHIDSDHIGGALGLLDEAETGASFGDIWFNGWRHLPNHGLETFGPVQGEKLTTLLDRPAIAWNRSFACGAVLVPEAGALPERELEGGLKLTLLSPGVQQLDALRPVWAEECRKANLDPRRQPPPVPEGFEAFGALNVEALAAAPFQADTSQANGSSIAVLAELDGRRLLLPGDAPPDVLLAGLQRLGPPGGRLRLDAFKLPHHGSQANLSRELLQQVECRRYLFSTDGTTFHHPDREGVARVIRFGGPRPELIFNYRTPYNEVWEDRFLQRRHGYAVIFPDHGPGLTVEL